MIRPAGLGLVVAYLRTLALGAILAFAGFFAPANAASSEPLQWSSPQKRILLVEPDVQLGELTVGGVIEPRADWSDRAAHAIESSLGSALSKRGIDVNTLATLTDPHEVQLAKLHAVVGMEILIHQMGFSKLPTKTSALDWTLGPGATDFRTKYGADYAMFVFLRDSYSSGSRKAMMFLGMANGGSQGAFATLVDLRTGNVVWFKQHFTAGGGDLRTETGADEFTADLLADFPQ
jgi:hypothetical protein